jgi:hypothetical protein
MLSFSMKTTIIKILSTSPLMKPSLEIFFTLRWLTMRHLSRFTSLLLTLKILYIAMFMKQSEVEITRLLMRLSKIWFNSLTGALINFMLMFSVISLFQIKY